MKIILPIAVVFTFFACTGRIIKPIQSGATLQLKQPEVSDTAGNILYVSVTEVPLILYETNDTSLEHSIIPSGKQIIIGKDEGEFIEVNFGGRPGFVKHHEFTNKSIYREVFYVKPLRKSDYLFRKIQIAEEQAKILNARKIEAQASNITCPTNSKYLPTQSGIVSPSRDIHTGPRGGQYYINKNGNKTYVKRK